jgi:hypothetical protein
VSGTGSTETASQGLAGTRTSPEAHRGAEGVGTEERTRRLAEVLKEVWMAGEQLNMAKPVGERIDWEMFARAIETRMAAVDTGADQVERGARAMFAVTNRLDGWAEPTVPEDLREHYRRLARAVLEAR